MLKKFFTRESKQDQLPIEPAQPTPMRGKGFIAESIFDSFVPLTASTGFYISYFRNIADAFSYASRVSPVADALKKITTEFSQIDKLLFKKNPDGSYTSDWDHPFVKLLGKPNSSQTSISFNEDYCNHRKIGGNTYVRASGLDKSKPPLELKCLRPELISINTSISQDNQIDAFEYQFNSEHEVFRRSNIDPATGKLSPVTRYFSDKAELFHFKNPTIYSAVNPLGDSDLQPLITEMLQYEYASIHNKSMLQNGMRPTGILVYKGQGELSEEQVNQFKDQLNDASGMSNAGKKLIVGGDFHWTPLSENMKDGDFLKNKRDNADNIYSTLGVPLALSTQTATMTFSNMDSARSLFYHGTILPFTMKVCQELFHTIFTLRYSDSSKYYKLGYDEATIPALQTEILDRSIKMKDSECFTLDERRLYAGAKKASKFGDAIMVHSGSVPIGTERTTPSSGNTP